MGGEGGEGSLEPSPQGPPPSDTLLSPLPLPPPLGLQNSWPRWQNLAFNNACVCYSWAEFSGFSRLPSLSLWLRRLCAARRAFVSFMISLIPPPSQLQAQHSCVAGQQGINSKSVTGASVYLRPEQGALVFRNCLDASHFKVTHACGGPLGMEPCAGLGSRVGTHEPGVALAPEGTKDGQGVKQGGGGVP